MVKKQQLLLNSFIHASEVTELEEVRAQVELE